MGPYLPDWEFSLEGGGVNKKGRFDSKIGFDF